MVFVVLCVLCGGLIDCCWCLMVCRVALFVVVCRCLLMMRVLCPATKICCVVTDACVV